MKNSDLNITEVNEWSLDFQDDFKKLRLMKFEDGTVEIDVENYGNTETFNLSKDQKEFLIKWLTYESNN